MTNVQKNIKRIRKKLGLTQLEMAIKCGLSPQMISSYETGKSDPNSSTITAIIDSLGLEAAELYN